MLDQRIAWDLKSLDDNLAFQPMSIEEFCYQAALGQLSLLNGPVALGWPGFDVIQTIRSFHHYSRQLFTSA